MTDALNKALIADDVVRDGSEQTPDTSAEVDWPDEIWAFQIKHDEYEHSGTYVCSDFATVPRWDGDEERDRPVQRYVDGDIHDSFKKYHKHQMQALAADNARLRVALEWYESKGNDCNRHGPEDNAARDALAKDTGDRARSALKGDQS